jgi:transcriptional regulator of acetoin/glycerol metabolism
VDTGAGVEAAARRVRHARHVGDVGAHVRPVVAESWQRSVDLGVDLARSATYVGHEPGPAAAAEAEEVFDRFLDGAARLDCAVLLVDGDGIVRVRRDACPDLAALLDAVLVAPGFRIAEQDVATTASALVRVTGRAARVDGPEHLHPDLACLTEAAAPVPSDTDAAPQTVVVVAHLSAPGGASALRAAVAAELARQVGERVRDREHRSGRMLHARFDDVCARSGAEWVVATDGRATLCSPGFRALPREDRDHLLDRALADAALADPPPAGSTAELPSGRRDDVVTSVVRDGAAVVGHVSSGRSSLPVPAGSRTTDAMRRQGSHVAPTARRDFAADFRDAHADGAAAEVRRRANRELLSPYLRARRDVAAAIAARTRHLLLVGEPGVGKQTLAVEQFRRSHPSGTVQVLDCARIAESGGPLLPTVRGTDGDRPRLLVLRRLPLLGSVAARRLDESLRVLVATPAAPTVVGCIDTPSVDATRPYGLLLRHFHDTVRVPALRYRADELGDLARSVLHSLSGGRSLSLSMQVLRVLEGYAWPGNLRELEDVLRYVIARKPVGVVQAPDLPSSCFTGGAPRMSMLEAAQCDVIIQALYEARGNRYQAAELLGIARSSLYRKIDAFGISYIG